LPTNLPTTTKPIQFRHISLESDLVRRNTQEQICRNQTMSHTIIMKKLLHVCTCLESLSAIPSLRVYIDSSKIKQGHACTMSDMGTHDHTLSYRKLLCKHNLLSLHELSILVSMLSEHHHHRVSKCCNSCSNITGTNHASAVYT